MTIEVLSVHPMLLDLAGMDALYSLTLRYNARNRNKITPGEMASLTFIRLEQRARAEDKRNGKQTDWNR